jgi:hypothetical protein
MVAQWLRYCATNRKVAGSIPDGVIGIFYWNNPYDRIMALGSTQRLTEIVPGAFRGGKGGLNFLEPSGPLQACNGTVLPLPSRIQFLLHDCMTKAPSIFETSGTCHARTRHPIPEDMNSQVIRLLFAMPTSWLLLSRCMWILIDSDWSSHAVIQSDKILWRLRTAAKTNRPVETNCWVI